MSFSRLSLSSLSLSRLGLSSLNLSSLGLSSLNLSSLGLSSKGCNSRLRNIARGRSSSSSSSSSSGLGSSGRLCITCTIGDRSSISTCGSLSSGGSLNSRGTISNRGNLSGRGGLGVLAGPSVGYIIGFPIAAFVTGWIVEQWRTYVALSATVAAFVGGFAVLNILGVIGMSVMLDKTLAEAALLALPFAAGDTIKSLIAGAVTAAIGRARPEALLSRA